MALGTLAVLGQLAGAGLNYFQGRQQRNEGETLAQEGRDKKSQRDFMLDHKKD